MARRLSGLLLAATSRRFQSGHTGSITHIPPYKPGTESILSAGNQVPASQKFFQIKKGDPYVFLRGSNDNAIYKGLLAISLAGVGVAYYCIYLMATGNMKRKERS